MKVKSIAVSLIPLAMLGIASVSLHAQQQPDAIAGGLNSHDGERIDKAVKQIREGLASNPVETVDQLNRTWLAALVRAKQYAAVEEFAVSGTIAVPADTWRIEQLQKHRIEALLAENKPDQALHAAKALFNVCGMGFTKDALPLLVDSLKAAHPDDPSIVPKFKLQVLANAQEDPVERKRLLAKYGGNSVMDAIPADPEPYKEAIEKRKGLTDYRGLYGTGNLLLLSGRIKEAHEVFMKVYQIAPPGELKYASEGIAKLIKAEDGGLGKANQFVMSIRPKEQ
jgi:tetratricopeptide (TPR) repeat protein